MKLNQWEAGYLKNRSSVDLLPEDIRNQLIEARTKGTHSTSAMVAWLHNEGYTNVTLGSLNWYFRSNSLKFGSDHAKS